jgi:hypothetical protein
MMTYIAPAGGCQAGSNAVDIFFDIVAFGMSEFGILTSHLSVSGLGSTELPRGTSINN